MTNDELAGRMLALEVITMTTLGLYLANNNVNDSDLSKARALFNFLEKTILQKAGTLPDAQQAEAVRYGDELLRQAFSSLQAFATNTGAGGRGSAR